MKGYEIIKILAIDQSTVKSGFSIFQDGKLICYDMINLKNETDLHKRFENMCLGLGSLISNTTPDYVVFEDVSLQTNAATMAVLARVQGAILQTVLFNKIPYKIYKPSSWRKILRFNQGRGIARKELKLQAINYVKSKYDIDTKEDIAEAICIGSAFLIENSGGNN